MQKHHVEARLLLLALLGLGTGVAVYLLDRGGAAYFVPGEIGAALPIRSVFGSLSGSLPAFAHVFAFALFTAALLGPGRVDGSRICLAWWGADSIFELGQANAVDAFILDLVPVALADVWPVAYVTSYFRQGTFDLQDLLAIALGAAAAFLVVSAMQSQGEKP